jgi:hypothetical protein
LTADERDKMIAALEALSSIERFNLKQVSTKELKPSKANRGTMRCLVLEAPPPRLMNGKLYQGITFQVLNPTHGYKPGQKIVNGYSDVVAQVSDDGKAMIYKFGTMPQVKSFPVVWKDKGQEVENRLLDPITKVERTEQAIYQGEVHHMTLKGTHNSMPPFTVVDLSISFTKYVSDPEKPLPPGEKPHLDVSRAVQDSHIVRRSNPIEIWQFLKSNPQFMNLPMPAPGEILRRNEYVHRHVMNLKEASKEESKETFYIPLFPTERDYVDFFGRSSGTYIVAEEDSSIDPNNPNNVQSAWEWHNFKTPNEKNMMASLKLRLIQWSSMAELVHPEAFPAPMFPRLTASMPLYTDKLPFKINDLGMWMKMAPSLFKNISMFVPTTVQFYQTFESPANNPANDKFSAQHVFLGAKTPILDFPGQLIELGLEVSADGAAALIRQNRLERVALHAAYDVFDPSVAKGERQFFNLNECTQAVALHRTSPTQRKNYRFFALLSKPISKGLRSIFAGLRAYMASRQESVVGGEVLLDEAWDLDVSDYMKKTYRDLPAGSPPPPAFPPDHYILTEKLRSIKSPVDTFILYAIDVQMRSRLEKELTSGDGPLVDLFKTLGSPTATPLLEGSAQQPPKEQKQIEGPTGAPTPQQLADAAAAKAAASAVAAAAAVAAAEAAAR